MNCLRSNREGSYGVEASTDHPLNGVVQRILLSECDLICPPVHYVQSNMSWSYLRISHLEWNNGYRSISMMIINFRPFHSWSCQVPLERLHGWPPHRDPVYRIGAIWCPVEGFLSRPYIKISSPPRASSSVSCMKGTHNHLSNA